MRRTYGSIPVAVILAAFLLAPAQLVRAASLFEVAQNGLPAPLDQSVDQPVEQPVAQPVAEAASGSVRLRVVDNGLPVDTLVPPASTSGTVEQLLASLSFVLAPEDVVFPARTAPAPSFGAVYILRAPAVALTYDGKKEELKTRATTVSELLAEKGVTLDDNDRVEPGTSAAVVPNMSVRVVRVDTKEVKETEEVAFASTSKDDGSLYEGDSKVVTAGKKGEKEITYKLTLEDGQQVQKERVSEKTLSEPVDEVIARGTKARPKTAQEGPFKEIINAAATKYSVDGAEMMRVMLCESGGYQWAKDSTGTYHGLFQYTRSFYKSGPYGDRDIYDVEGQIYNTAYFWSIGRRSAWGC